MKKIFYSLIVLLFPIITIVPSFAEDAGILTGPPPSWGPTLTGPPPSWGPTLTGPPPSWGPTVVVNNSGPVGASGGSYAIVDSNGNVTNTIVCHSFCENGTFGPGGDTVALQMPNSNAGLWFGPGTTTYDRETKTFTATDPVSRETKITDGESSVIISGNKVLTFVSGNIFLNNGILSGVQESWTLNSTANASVTENNIKESLGLGNRKTSQQVRNLIEDSDLLLLNERVEVLINLLGSWVK
jgi:hypothetical protein